MSRSSNVGASTSSTIAVALGQGVLVPWAVQLGKLKALARRVRHLLNERDREHLEHAQAIENVLRKLDKRQRQLEEDLAFARTGGESAKLRQRLAVVEAMRKKGMRFLHEERSALS